MITRALELQYNLLILKRTSYVIPRFYQLKKTLNIAPSFTAQIEEAGRLVLRVDTVQ